MRPSARRPAATVRGWKRPRPTSTNTICRSPVSSSASDDTDTTSAAAVDDISAVANMPGRKAPSGLSTTTRTGSFGSPG